MKVLYHHRTQAEDGQAVHIRALIEALRAEKHDVCEVALVEAASSTSASSGAREDTDSRKRSYSWIGKVPRFARELAEYAYTVPARRKILTAAREFAPDFIYERYAFGCAGGVQAAERLGIPLVLEVNSPMVLELSRTRGLSFPRYAERLETSIFRRATRVCVVTDVLKGMLVEMGVAADSIFVTPNGVHPELFAGADRAGAFEGLGLGALAIDGPVLGFVGYYRDWHRLDLVIEALTDPALETAHLVLVGAGPAEDDLRAVAARSGVSARVHFPGTRPHARIPALLAAFDLALVPAINPYASPLKLHEYMAAGLATIAPDQPNLREVLEDEVNALLVPANDGEALRRALVRLATDADLRARLGAAARDTILERELTWRGNARRVLAAVAPFLKNAENKITRMTMSPLHALSFDVEEFFHVANLAHHFPPDTWDDVPSRLDVGMDAILALLEREGVRATMFFLGWIAERHPGLVRRCVDAGHEIASHGYEHRFLSDIGSPEALDVDLARTEEVLIAAGAPRPVGFRASTFTLTRDTWWAFDVLVARGYEYDSSVHPVRHPTYGVPDFEPAPSIVHAPGGAGTIIEFPVATYPVLGRNLPVGGGGYFRLLPGPVHRAALRGLERKGRPAAVYLHPWEFDPDQPRYPAPAFKRFRHYLNLDKSLGRLERLLTDFRFGTMREALAGASLV